MTTITSKRQRMYLFERAYVDYAARIRRFWQRLTSTVRGTWDFFWDGLGSRIIEIIISVILFAAAVYACYWYVQYELSHGRGFSLTMLGAILVIFAVTLVILFGWKAPLHFISRVASGIVASGIILLLMLVALVAFVIFFTLYLVVLFVLTVLSFIIFLPLRAGQELWLLYRKISYRCPYDDCAGSGLPIHICPCGTQYRDLLPSFYGIFYHTCQHNREVHKLPTMDFLGRNKLDRLCSTCERPLILSSIGVLAEKPIAVVGGTDTGKTVFIRQAVRLLEREISSIRGAKVSFDSLEQENLVKGDLVTLDRGQVIAKTAGRVQQAIGLAIRVPKPANIQSLYYLFDAPGEQFELMSLFGEKQVIQHLKGIILMVDPFSLPGLVDFKHLIPLDTHPSETPFWNIVSTLMAGVNQMLVRRPTDPCKIPLAVVISKADAFPVDDFPFLNNLVSTQKNPHTPDLSDRCRQAIQKLGEGRAVRALEQKFTNVQYFAASALGRNPELGNKRPFQPEGALEPFLWVMDLQVSQPGQQPHRVMVPAGAGTGD